MKKSTHKAAVKASEAKKNESKTIGILLRLERTLLRDIEMIAENYPLKRNEWIIMTLKKATRN